MLWVVCPQKMNDIFNVRQIKVRVPIKRGANIGFFRVNAKRI